MGGFEGDSERFFTVCACYIKRDEKEKNVKNGVQAFLICHVKCCWRKPAIHSDDINTHMCAGVREKSGSMNVCAAKSKTSKATKASFLVRNLHYVGNPVYCHFR